MKIPKPSIDIITPANLLLDFGTFDIGELPYRDMPVIVINRATDPDDYLRITPETNWSIGHPTMTIAKPLKSIIGAGESDTMMVRFSPTVPGDSIFGRTYTIRSNDENRPQITIYCQGKGIGLPPPECALSIDSASYSRRNYGT